MPRGRLIFPFMVDIAQLDTAATAADPDVGGPLVSGYDPIFREPVIVPPGSGSGRGQVVRVETLVQLFAQIEPASEDTLSMQATGRSPDSRTTLIFHFEDLERVGMVDLATGRPLLRGPGDRLVAVRHPTTGALIHSYPNPPGMYATEVQSRGFGLGPDRNLLLVVFESRDVSAGA